MNQASASVAAVEEGRCGFLVEDASGVHDVPDPDLHVLAGTAAEGAFAPVRPAGAIAIQCGRSSIVPGPHDDEVLALRMTFVIHDMNEPGRIGVLELVRGQYRFRMIQGNLRSTEEPLMQARLDSFQSRSQGD